MISDPRVTAGDPHACLAALVSGTDLTRAASEALFSRIMDGDVPPALIAGLLVAFRAKGETEHEIAGAARVMRARATRVRTTREPLIDTCGTGGDFSGSFNVSTAAALVVAAAGIAVAKHGNRAASSRCGSADVLEALGIPVDLDPAQVGRSIDELGIGFLFAPLYHPAMRHAAEARRELGIRTVFNLVGPLTNPAGARRQLIGVPSTEAVPRIAGVLRELGAEAAIVVHGEEGLDEISVSGPTRIAVLLNGSVEERTIEPHDLGLSIFGLQDIFGGDPELNARILREVAEGRGSEAHRAVVAANAGSAIWIAGGAPSIRAGVERAWELLAAGAAAKLLDDLIAFTRRMTASSAAT
ncbi:MAG TPA: anthranilate phosphoribosyltransferase [Gemmatimonadota bacterium]|nr:anthranilate phosphoribosyltransferase [Gemmatimonadota bacterium]